jgi:hypothetical protein
LWNEIVRFLPDFQSAVLIGLEDSGYPFSIRCKPEVDEKLQLLRVNLPDYVNIQSGPAGLMCHKHDEKVWNLKSFIVRGSLERSDGGWLFRPKKFVSGFGGGVLGTLKFVRDGRRTAKNYLKKRHLERPIIPWKKINKIWEEIERSEAAETNS